MQQDHFADLLTYGHQRVERCHRVLEHHCNALAADGQPVLFLQLIQTDAVKFNAAADDRTVFIGHADQRLGQYAFAGAGLSDDGQRLVFVKIQTGAAHSGQSLSAKAEVDTEVANAQYGFGHDCVPSLNMVVRVGSIRKAVADDVKRNRDKREDDSRIDQLEGIDLKAVLAYGNQIA